MEEVDINLLTSFYLYIKKTNTNTNIERKISLNGSMPTVLRS